MVSMDQTTRSPKVEKMRKESLVAFGTIFFLLVSINGTLVGNVNNDEPIEIGTISYAGGSQYFNGIIDNPRLWNIALTQEQIRSIYESDG